MTDYTTLSDRELVEAVLLAEAEAESSAKALRQAKDELLHRKRSAIAQAYADKESQFGVIHLEEGEHRLDITTSQRVEWDQEKLASLQQEIRKEWENDPAEYIDSKLSVKESKYKAWPSDLRSKFEPARTVKPSAPSLTITIIDKE